MCEPLKDTKWGNSVKGRPDGKFCYKCLSVLVALYPGEEPEQVAERFHADPAIQKEIKIGLRLHESLEERIFTTPSAVSSQQEQGHIISFKLALVSEADVVKHLKVSGKALKLQEVTVELEQQRCSLKGYVVSLSKLPADLLETCHKIKVYSKTSIHLSDQVLDGERMLSPQQPLRLFQHLSTAQTERNPSAFKCQQRNGLLTFDDLAAKAEKVLEAGRVCCSKGSAKYMKF